MKNTLPEVVGTFPFGEIGPATGATRICLPSGVASVDRRSPSTATRTAYGVAFFRLAASSANQKLATCRASGTLEASGIVTALAACAGPATTAEPSTLMPMPNAISTRLKIGLQFGPGTLSRPVWMEGRSIQAIDRQQDHNLARIAGPVVLDHAFDMRALAPLTASPMISIPERPLRRHHRRHPRQSTSDDDQGENDGLSDDQGLAVRFKSLPVLDLLSGLFGDVSWAGTRRVFTTSLPASGFIARGLRGGGRVAAR